MGGWLFFQEINFWGIFWCGLISHYQEFKHKILTEVHQMKWRKWFRITENWQFNHERQVDSGWGSPLRSSDTMNVLYLLCVFAVAGVGAGLVIVSYSRWNIYAPPLQHKYLYKYGTIHLGELRGGILPMPGTLLHYSVQGGLTTLHWWHFQRGTVSASISRSLLGKCIKYPIRNFLWTPFISAWSQFIWTPCISHYTNCKSELRASAPLGSGGHWTSGHRAPSSIICLFKHQCEWCEYCMWSM